MTKTSKFIVLLSVPDMTFFKNTFKKSDETVRFEIKISFLPGSQIPSVTLGKRLRSC